MSSCRIFYASGDYNVDPHCKLLQRIPSELAGVVVCCGSWSWVHAASLACEDVL